MEAPTRVTLVLHTHWDREWHEPFSVFSEQLVGMMETLLDLIAQGFPHFHLDGQTAMIDDYLDRRPERSRDVAGAVSAGRLSAGPWVTQMDEFLTSGESHIRNSRWGSNAHVRLAGRSRSATCGISSDTSGRCRRSCGWRGSRRAMVWRGVPSAIGTSTFRWRSPDGSELLAASLPLGYSSGSSLLRTEDPRVARDGARNGGRAATPYAPDGRIVVMVGYDHAGPDATLPSRLGCTAAGGSGRADRQRRVARAGARDERRPAGLDTPCTRRSPRL